jgi:carbamoyltransferase
LACGNKIFYKDWELIMYVLGIHDGHNCGATLVRDGVIVASVCEERLTRKKNEAGYPRQAIEDVMCIGGIEAKDLESVVYASLFMHAKEHLQDVRPWYRVNIKDQRRDEAKPKAYGEKLFQVRKQERIDEVCAHLRVSETRVCFVEHHTAHLAAAYYTAPNVGSDEKVLGLTCDGAGDGLAATVSVCNGNEINRIAATDRHASLGKIYSRVTMMMGMKPWEHEYKLMGLAPYADLERTQKAVEPLRSLLGINVENLVFERKSELSTNYIYDFLQEAFREVRFDVIASATQAFTEELLLEWVKACVQKTGVKKLVCGGGVFMNVKANMLLAQLEEVESLYVMPSGGDESLSIGAALYHYYQESKKLDHGGSVLTDLYLGGSSSEEDEREAIDKLSCNEDILISQPEDIDNVVASLLADGKVVARCRGRMEWGARSLGNRSILCSADDYRMVDHINKMIKVRDFWMPFAPSIREESAEDYIDDPKDLKPWFMTFAYPAKEGGYSHLAAASHPRDHTVRPQVVTATANPGYHAMISRFKELTGRGVVLNTSFNLHGEPVVYKAADAIRVFLLSGLDCLALDNHLLVKKKRL